MVKGGGFGEMELSHERRSRPCPYKGGGGNRSNRRGLLVNHITDVAFSGDGDGPVPVEPPAGAPAVPHGAALPWKYGIAGEVVLWGLLNRVREVLTAMSAHGFLATALKWMFGFLFGEGFVFIHSTENGVFVGFCESLRGEHSLWFACVVRMLLYGYIAGWYECRNKIWMWGREKVGRRSTVACPRRMGQTPPASEPSSDVGDSACIKDQVAMNVRRV